MSYIKNPESTRGVYNSAAFDGTVTSDFLELGKMSDDAKKDLINYSADGFDEYKAALIAYLKAVYPTDFNNFVESDLGIMMLELFAYVASNLSFKADMLANESFLSTAQSLSNVRKLLQLIGVDLRGPVSAKATAFVSLEDVANALSAGETLTLNSGNRTVSVPNTKQGGMLTFTLYKYNTTTGEINLHEPDISLTKDESLEGGGVSWNNVVFMEGEYGTHRGTFSVDALHQEITLPSNSVTEGSIVVSAQDGAVYREIRNIYMASGAEDTVFQKTYSDDYTPTLRFGDGTRGRRPSPGHEFLVMYRIGGGDKGNIPSEFISMSVQGKHTTEGNVVVNSKNIKSATGGLPPETITHAKRWAPNFFRTQYRAVTGQDYTTLANSFRSTQGAVGKALAVLRNSGAGANMIDIYCLSKASQTHLERASLTFKKELLTYMNDFKMLTDEISIVDGLVRTLDLVCTIYVDKRQKDFEGSVKSGVRTAIEQFFNVENREFGETLSVGELTRTIFDVSHVKFANIDNLDGDIKVAFNELIQLNNLEFSIEYI
jgi:hypothetical protein